MTGRNEVERPRARLAGLLVEEVGPELVVYDSESGDAHRLSAAAASIWRDADGTRTADELARRIEGLDPALAADVVSHALAQLAGKGLLEPGTGRTGMSRRQLLARLGAAGVGLAALPVIDSITNAAAAQVGSCVGLGGPCSLPSDCCPGLTCSGQTETCV